MKWYWWLVVAVALIVMGVMIYGRTKDAADLRRALARVGELERLGDELERELESARSEADGIAEHAAQLEREGIVLRDRLERSKVIIGDLANENRRLRDAVEAGVVSASGIREDSERIERSIREALGILAEIRKIPGGASK